jgi:hypothetical protein
MFNNKGNGEKRDKPPRFLETKLRLYDLGSKVDGVSTLGSK